jgi:hypothetical protein
VSTQLWIGFGFGALFFVFLMVAFFAAKNLTPGQHLILRIMTSLCAGMAAAGLIGGDASISVTEGLPGGRITGGFGAGIAVLIGVLLLFPRYPKPSVLNGQAFSFSIPKERKFQPQGLKFMERDQRLLVVHVSRPLYYGSGLASYSCPDTQNTL